MRMRLKMTSKDMSTHHFNAWQLPMRAGVSSQGDGEAVTLVSIRQSAIEVTAARKVGRKSRRIEMNGQAK